VTDRRTKTTGQEDGKTGGSLISVNFKTALPNTKVIAHVLPWFGSASHIQLNYTLRDGITVLPYQSWNPAICDDQCENMASAGIAAVNVDYYGMSSGQLGLNKATLAILDACERAGLAFSICVDAGAITGLATGSVAQAQYLAILQYLYDTFFPNSAYLLDAKGNPIVSFFGEPAGIDWTTLAAAAPCPMSWIFENNFSHVHAAGAFGWVSPTTPANNWNQAYITGFNASAAANPSLMSWYPMYAGFDDGAAAWGTNRVMSRLCGKTLLNTVGMVPKTATHALLSTWNDWEEGTQNEESAAAAAGAV
jgi:hypothetical protein